MIVWIGSFSLGTAALAAPPACPRIESSKCSVETYSSPNVASSSWAFTSTVRSRGEMPGCAPAPLTRGNFPISARTC